jgi:hypothetical protein
MVTLHVGAGTFPAATEKADHILDPEPYRCLRKRRRHCSYGAGFRRRSLTAAA